MTAGPFAATDPDRVAAIARRISALLDREQCDGPEVFAAVACCVSVRLMGCSPAERSAAAHLLADAILAGDPQIPEHGHA